MRVEIIRLGKALQHMDGDVRTVVGDTFDVAEQVHKRNAALHVAFAALETVDVPLLEDFQHRVDRFLERLHAQRRLAVRLPVGGIGQIENRARRLEEIAQFAVALRGKMNVVLVHIPRHIRNVHAVIADALEIADRQRRLLRKARLFMIQIVRVDLHDVFRQRGLALIEEGFVFLKLRRFFFAVFAQQLRGKDKIFLARFRHRADDLVRLLQRDGRRMQEAGI